MEKPRLFLSTVVCEFSEIGPISNSDVLSGKTLHQIANPKLIDVNHWGKYWEYSYLNHSGSGSYFHWKFRQSISIMLFKFTGTVQRANHKSIYFVLKLGAITFFSLFNSSLSTRIIGIRQSRKWKHFILNFAGWFNWANNYGREYVYNKAVHFWIINFIVWFCNNISQHG